MNPFLLKSCPIFGELSASESKKIGNIIWWHLIFGQKPCCLGSRQVDRRKVNIYYCRYVYVYVEKLLKRTFVVLSIYLFWQKVHFGLFDYNRITTLHPLSPLPVAIWQNQLAKEVLDFTFWHFCYLSNWNMCTLIRFSLKLQSDLNKRTFSLQI